MRFYLIVMLLLMLGSQVQSQSTPALMGIQFDRSNIGKGFNSGTGISIEGWFGKHFSLNYSFLYQPVGPDEYYLYTGGGQAAGVYVIRKAIEERSGLALAVPLGIVAFVLPESYGFRTPIGEKSQLGLFLAPYGFEFVKDRATEEEEYDISIELGCRYYLAVNQWIYLVPQIGIKSVYGEDGTAVSYGISLMFKVDKNKTKDL